MNVSEFIPPYPDFSMNKNSLLKRACGDGDYEKVKSIIDMSVALQSPVAIYSRDVCILEIAIESENIKLVEYLLDYIFKMYGPKEIAFLAQRCFEAACLAESEVMCKNIFKICAAYDEVPDLAELEDEDILADIVKLNKITIFKLLVQLNEIKDLNLEFDNYSERDIFGKNLLIKRISYLFLLACKYNNPEMATLILHSGHDIEVFPDIIDVLIEKDCIEAAEVILEFSDAVKKNGYEDLFENIIVDDRSVSVCWMIKMKLVKYTLQDALLKAFKAQSIKTVKYILLNKKDFDFDETKLTDVYASLLIGPVKTKTYELCNILCDLLESTKYRQKFIDINTKALQHSAKSLNKNSIELILKMIPSVSIDTIRDCMYDVIEMKTDRLDEHISVFKELFSSIKNQIEKDEIEYITSMAFSSVNKIKIFEEINRLRNSRFTVTYSELDDDFYSVETSESDSPVTPVPMLLSQNRFSMLSDDDNNLHY